MFDRRLRPVKDAALGALCDRLAPAVPAWSLTLAALVAALSAAGAAWAGWTVASVVAWWLSRTLDGLDGPVARRRGEAGDLGGYVDMLADTVGYAAVPLGVALGVDQRSTWIALAVLLAAFYLNTVSWAYLAALLEKRGQGARQRDESTAVTMPPALIEGTETIVAFTVMLLVPSAATLVFAFTAALVAVNVLQRVWWARRHLGHT